jgi:hypothetical protein
MSDLIMIHSSLAYNKVSTWNSRYLLLELTSIRQIYPYFTRKVECIHTINQSKQDMHSYFHYDPPTVHYILLGRRLTRRLQESMMRQF